MSRKVIKGILAIATGLAALAAAPASAGTVVTYYGMTGWGVMGITGYDVYCDSGALYYQTGYATEYYSTSWQSIPC